MVCVHLTRTSHIPSRCSSTGDVFICMSCDAAKGGVNIDDAPHNEAHALVRCQPFVPEVEALSVEGRLARMEKLLEASSVEDRLARLEKLLEASSVEDRLARVENFLEASSRDDRLGRIENSITAMLQKFGVEQVDNAWNSYLFFACELFPHTLTVKRSFFLSPFQNISHPLFSSSSVNQHSFKCAAQAPYAYLVCTRSRSYPLIAFLPLYVYLHSQSSFVGGVEVPAWHILACPCVWSCWNTFTIIVHPTVCWPAPHVSNLPTHLHSSRRTDTMSSTTGYSVTLQNCQTRSYGC